MAGGENSATLRITCVIPSLSAGGAERNMAWLCERLASRGHAVTLMTLTPGGRTFFAPSAIVRLCQAPASAMAGIRFYRLLARRRRWSELRAAIEDTRPDLVISFIDVANIYVLRAMRGTGVPVIVSERTDMSRYAIDWKLAAMRRMLYPSAAAVVMAAPDNIALAARHRPRWRVRHIPNPVHLPKSKSGGGRPSWFGRRNVIAMGRLVPPKGFDLLLSAFAEIARRVPDWHLTIIGEGELRADLEAQVTRLGLEGRVTLAGLVQDPEVLFAEADLFVLSSRFEGFPNALAEAMSCGLPVVSFDCGGGGPAHIVRHGIDGWLVSPVAPGPLARALFTAMSDDAARLRMAQEAPGVAERFSEDRVLAAWLEVISRVTGVVES